MIIKGSITENSPATLTRRIIGDDGEYIVAASVDTITAKVFDQSSGEQIGDALSYDSLDTVFDTLQTDLRWTSDDIGYNFLLVVPGSYFPTGGRVYRVEVKLTPFIDEYGDDGEPRYLLWDLYADNIFSE
jgi:hypothetical protein